MSDSKKEIEARNLVGDPPGNAWPARGTPARREALELRRDVLQAHRRILADLPALHPEDVCALVLFRQAFYCAPEGTFLFAGEEAPTDVLLRVIGDYVRVAPDWLIRAGVLARDLRRNVPAAVLAIYLGLRFWREALEAGILAEERSRAGSPVLPDWPILAEPGSGRAADLRRIGSERRAYLWPRELRIRLRKPTGTGKDLDGSLLDSEDAARVLAPGFGRLFDYVAGESKRQGKKLKLDPALDPRLKGNRDAASSALLALIHVRLPVLGSPIAKRGKDGWYLLPGVADGARAGCLAPREGADPMPEDREAVADVEAVRVALRARMEIELRQPASKPALAAARACLLAALRAETLSQTEAARAAGVTQQAVSDALAEEIARLRADPELQDLLDRLPA